jgi:hypothetical protein
VAPAFFGRGSQLLRWTLAAALASLIGHRPSARAHGAATTVPGEDQKRAEVPLHDGEADGGSLRLVSRKRYRGGPASIPKHVTIGPVPLHTAEAKTGDTIPPGKTGYVCPKVPASTRGLLRNTAAVGDAKPTPTVEFQLVVSSDLAGNDVVRRTNYALTIPPPGEAFRPLQSDCSTLRAR